jgi:hypothetical protein
VENFDIPEGFVMITREHFDRLKGDEAWRVAMENAGVDNWSGYDYAMELMRGDDD